MPAKDVTLGYTRVLKTFYINAQQNFVYIDLSKSPIFIDLKTLTDIYLVAQSQTGTLEVAGGFAVTVYASQP